MYIPRLMGSSSGTFTVTASPRTPDKTALTCPTERASEETARGREGGRGREREGGSERERERERERETERERERERENERERLAPKTRPDAWCSAQHGGARPPACAHVCACADVLLCEHNCG
jgi:hypothetical protein